MMAATDVFRLIDTASAIHFCRINCCVRHAALVLDERSLRSLIVLCWKPGRGVRQGLRASRFIRAEITKWAKVVREAKIQIE
jgi:hypothetical protein